MPEQKWAIVGGGMLGLALAHKLNKQGRDVTILEAGDRFGGLAEAWRIGDYTWDRHYHVTLLSDRNLRGLLADIGIEDQLNWTTTKTDFYADDTYYPLNNAIDYIRFGRLNLIDKARLAFTILYASMLKNGVRLECIPVGDWLTRLSGRRVYERIWQPLLRAKLGDNSKIVSASFIWSVINRFYGARRSGLKTEMFGYVKGGYSAILERLIADLQSRGVATKASSPVRNIARVGDKLRITTPTGHADFDRVIVTVAGPLAARMVPELDAEELARLNGLKYQGVVCTSLLLRQSLRGRYLTYIADESIPFTGVIEMTAVVDKADFGGNALVYLPRYVPSDHALFDRPDAEIEAEARAKLLAMYPHLDQTDILAMRTSKARNVMAVQDLDYSRRVPAMTTSVDGLFVVNSAQIINGNLNVDETIALADRAAAALATLERAEPDRWPLATAAE
ncbi:MAG: NAD(P)/FAD-dependent oxidoreductase [Alphaproteobacteria bacterium]|nr:NAD(P)/FAD-dependent oxidoreductase [Alphaproteobacteria bacterium]